MYRSSKSNSCTLCVFPVSHASTARSVVQVCLHEDRVAGCSDHQPGQSGGNVAAQIKTSSAQMLCHGRVLSRGPLKATSVSKGTRLEARPMVDCRAGWWCFQSLIGSAVGEGLMHVTRRVEIKFGQQRVEGFVITTTSFLTLIELVQAARSTGDRGASVVQWSDGRFKVCSLSAYHTANQPDCGTTTVLTYNERSIQRCKRGLESVSQSRCYPTVLEHWLPVRHRTERNRRCIPHPCCFLHLPTFSFVLTQFHNLGQRYPSSDI